MGRDRLFFFLPRHICRAFCKWCQGLSGCPLKLVWGPKWNIWLLSPCMMRRPPIFLQLSQKFTNSYCPLTLLCRESSRECSEIGLYILCYLSPLPRFFFFLGLFFHFGRKSNQQIPCRSRESLLLGRHALLPRSPAMGTNLLLFVRMPHSKLNKPLPTFVGGISP